MNIEQYLENYLECPNETPHGEYLLSLGYKELRAEAKAALKRLYMFEELEDYMIEYILDNIEEFTFISVSYNYSIEPEALLWVSIGELEFDGEYIASSETFNLMLDLKAVERYLNEYLTSIIGE